jgi:glycosyltransferase involved in cell wall biosynthesis
MDYPPNIAAVAGTARSIMPAIRAAHPPARFHVVGRAPAPEVRALDGANGTRVWGEVPDVRPFVGAADLVVAPLAIARGIQNKVLEAMAMARPVLLTPSAAAGIGAVDDRHYAVAAEDSALAERALLLLGDEASARTMGAAARRFVIDHKSWKAVLAPLASIVGRPASEARDAA